MITNDYFQGLQKALKLVEQNLDHRLETIDKWFKQENLMTEDQYRTRQSEIIMVKSHIVQVRESYRKLVEDLNRGIKG